MAARYLLGYVQVGTPDTDTAEECPRCGFDALLTFPCVVLSDAGVSRLPPFRVCVRCWDEAHPEGD